MKKLIVTLFVMSIALYANAGELFHASEMRLGLGLPCLSNIGGNTADLELKWKDGQTYAVIDLECGYVFILPKEDPGVFIKTVTEADYEHKEKIRFLKGGILIIYPPR